MTSDQPAAPSYAAMQGWREYRRILAERFDIADGPEPREEWRDWRGHRLHLDVHEPMGAARGTLILVHGAGGHGRLLAPLGEVAARAGWRAIAPDLPGYGITQTRIGWREDYAEWPECVADLARATPGPVVLLGLSVGGMTAVRAAQLALNVAGVIATTLIDLADPATFIHAARWPWLGRLSLLAMRWAPWAMDPMPLPLWLATPLAAMTGDPALQRWFVRDPQIGRRWVRGRFFRSLHQYAPPRADLALPCSLLLVHPGADAWTPTAMSMAAFDAVPGPKRLRELSNGSHLPVEAPAWGELCEELRRVLDAVAQNSPLEGCQPCSSTEAEGDDRCSSSGSVANSRWRAEAEGFAAGAW